MPSDIHVYTTTRNEAYMLPFFLRHYYQFASHIYVIDDGSTDGTRDIATSHPNTTLLNYTFHSGLNESHRSEERRVGKECRL